ncbi:hypothetical protein DAI22_04g117550 [Oryza sativa Japonica Group]|nr:hypothetical protein DAI22_04g117550 [Oryza sativa Japonica Group]KAF2933849.1 hypothetical protein DAI22_04g117550 [Oryza sativa Japonica Group]KAF2933851.1 hypothetical protein DAI22_04g117550 [Oryza sativa Japonica Group]
MIWPRPSFATPCSDRRRRISLPRWLHPAETSSGFGTTMGNNLVFKRSSSGDSHPKSMNGKRKLDDRIELGDNMISNIAPDCCYPESIYKRRRSNQQLEKLPEVH